MVKRQTVWLSTMMVLSLMLIGYYTMNGGSQTASTGDNQGPLVSTSVTSGSGGQPSSGGQGSTQTASKTPVKATSGVPSETESDWFLNYQNQVEQNLSKKEDMYQSILTNNNSSTEQIMQAEQQLKQLQNLEGGMADALDAIRGEGYKNCVIVPSMDGDTVTVYVQAKNLTADQAVQIMNIVARQMNVPINHVNVNWK